MRTLADETGINMMTVNKAYQLLRQEGYLQIDRRSGARITLPAGVSTDHSEADAHALAITAQSLTALQPQLELLISEARLHGISEQAFLDACHRIFQSQQEV